jgi:cytochrome c556
MKAASTLCRVVVVTSVGALAVAGCGSMQRSGEMSTDKAVAERQELMKRQGGAMRSISDKLKAGNVQAVASDAEVLISTSKQIPALFPSPTSRAKPEIWQQWSEFQKYAKMLEQDATKLRAAAQANDASGAQAAAGAVGKGSCGGCHTAFRGPEIKK